MQRDTTKVLMIDDNEDDFAIVRRNLSRVEEHSYSVQWAASYEDGLAELNEGDFDVCLVDYRLGASTGIELFEATAGWKSRPPFILLTGYTDREVDVQAMNAGAADYLNKHEITPAMLERSIRYAIEHQQAKRRLEVTNDELQQEVTRRLALRTELVETSRRAGMAEIATGVLHNVGNVLNSVNVSVNVLFERLRGSRVQNLSKATDLITRHTDNLAAFLTSDERGKQLPGYIEKLASHLCDERQQMLDEIDSLTQNIDHIKQIINTQQSYARFGGTTERVILSDLVNDSLSFHFGELTHDGVKVVREFNDDQVLRTEKHQVMQILVNLIGNAKHALRDCQRDDKRLTLGVSSDGNFMRAEVRDNGIGIPRQSLSRIFEHGFTTKQDGHGYGLHICALAASELGGSLSAHSDGPGCGAAFVLAIPVTSDEALLCNV